MDIFVIFFGTTILLATSTFKVYFSEGKKLTFFRTLPFVIAAVNLASIYYLYHMMLWEKTVTAPIRIDLLFLYLVLLVLNIIGFLCLIKR
jgi:hypothetical protein